MQNYIWRVKLKKLMYWNDILHQMNSTSLIKLNKCESNRFQNDAYAKIYLQINFPYFINNIQ